MGAWPPREVDACPNRRASRARTDVERRNVPGATPPSVREASAHGRPDRRGVDALPRHPRAPSRQADPGARRQVSRKREKEKVVIRVPNPKAPVKERLKTP